MVGESKKAGAEVRSRALACALAVAAWLFSATLRAQDPLLDPPPPAPSSPAEGRDAPPPKAPAEAEEPVASPPPQEDAAEPRIDITPSEEAETRAEEASQTAVACEAEPERCARRLCDDAATKKCVAQARALLELLAGLKGASLKKRIVGYEDHIRAYPEGRFAPYLWEEAQALRKLFELRIEELRKREVKVLHFAPPREAMPAEPLTIAFEVRGDVKAITLHLRHGGEHMSFVAHAMRPSADRFWSYTIAASDMQLPAVEYYVEAELPDGATKELIAAPDLPARIELRDLRVASPMDGAAMEMAMWTDYADYNRFRGNDYAWQTEGYFGLRFGDTGMRALRSGFGVYRGVGGGVEELDERGGEGRPIGLTYGWIETELGFHEMVALIGRGMIGLVDDGVTGGAQAFVRIGNDRDTNMLLGGELLGGVGLRGILQLELQVVERLPMVVRTEITNQPAGVSLDDGSDTADVGGRIIAQLGYELFDGFTLAARGSYQGRTLKHSGPGFGGGVRYTW